MTQLPTIVVDTREQTPHAKLDGVSCTYERHGLEVGDYALRDDCIETVRRKVYVVRFAVERKSVGDFVNSWFGRHRAGSGWVPNGRNEERKISVARWCGFRLPYFLDGNELHIARFDYGRFPSGRVSELVVLSKVSELRHRGHQVVLCANKASAEIQIVQYLKRRFEWLGRVR